MLIRIYRVIYVIYNAQYTMNMTYFKAHANAQEKGWIFMYLKKWAEDVVQ